MGHEIERVLIDRGHTVLFTVDAGEEAKLATERLAQADVAIEFTTPATAFGNVETCLRDGSAVVCGTTGWNERREEAEKLCEELDGTFFWSSNFSIGVNILFRVSEYLARIMGPGSRSTRCRCARCITQEKRMRRAERLSRWPRVFCVTSAGPKRG